jgi:hypothetical protein
MNADITSGTLLQSLLVGFEGRPAKSPDHAKQRFAEPLSAVAAAKQLVDKAKRAADISLDRAKTAPKPHEITNPVFVALFDAHQRDREVLFAAMRALEAARLAAEAE